MGLLIPESFRVHPQVGFARPMGMKPWLVAGVFLLGCGRCPESTTTPAVPTVVRAQIRSGLVLQCSHLVVGEESICGILTVQNTGKEPLALVDRWNSWGAYQWVLSIGGRTASNPQVSWYGNYYSETLLAPGEARHAWFSVTKDYRSPVFRQDAWRFQVRGPFHLTLEGDTFQSFTAGEPLIVTLQGIPPVIPSPQRELPVGLWSGAVTATSTEVGSLAELEELVQGQLLR